MSFTFDVLGSPTTGTGTIRQSLVAAFVIVHASHIAPRRQYDVACIHETVVKLGHFLAGLSDGCIRAPSGSSQ